MLDLDLDPDPLVRGTDPRIRICAKISRVPKTPIKNGIPGLLKQVSP
jgi:hypothetical protein